MAPLAEVQVAEATVNVGEEAILEVRGQTAGEDQAKKLQGSIRTWQNLARGYLLLMALKGGDEAKASQQLGKLLSQLKVEARGSELHATLKTDADTIASGLILLPGAIGK
jgi:hypothetical protein